MTKTIKAVGARVRSRFAETTGPNGTHDEDGNRYITETVYVEAYGDDGAAYTHAQLSVEDPRETHREALEAVALRITERGSLDASLWTFARWTYGSGDWEADALADEINDARRDGEAHPMDR